MQPPKCVICGFVYDEDVGIPEKGIAPGTTWNQLPADWKCPLCGAAKSQFIKQEQKSTEPLNHAAPTETKTETFPESGDELREMTNSELAALCSNLARGCEKQYLTEEAALYTQLAEYYTAKTSLPKNAGFDNIAEKISRDLSYEFPAAKSAAENASDRGAKRVLTWTEKVSRMSGSILEQYEKDGNAFLENTKIWVCDICGFIYVGEVPPAVCPVCKVPSFKILEVTRV